MAGAAQEGGVERESGRVSGAACFLFFDFPVKRGFFVFFVIIFALIFQSSEAVNRIRFSRSTPKDPAFSFASTSRWRQLPTLKLSSPTRSVNARLGGIFHVIELQPKEK